MLMSLLSVELSLEGDEEPIKVKTAKDTHARERGASRRP